MITTRQGVLPPTGRKRRGLCVHVPLLWLRSRCQRSKGLAVRRGSRSPPSPRPVCASVCGANRPADPREAVHFDVFGQVVAAGELLLAHLTLVGFDTRVGTPVSGQLV